ncbi:helix-turn-helix domain-containing protein [Bacillus sp. 3255]|uniref:helix-turn-helix domain-containing protein n=1 Tax=Bacillus sp. 3255 TaxID=2817904 RepID=UPI00286CEF67|nr:helix-turn-helix domain-containing protein [Bacillus sp. 3255]
MGNMLINILYINYEPPVPSWYYGNHCHSSYELHFIPKGRGLLRVSHQQFQIEPGIFYVTGPGVYHEQLADRDDPMSEYCINFEIKIRSGRQTKGSTYLQSEIDEVLRTLTNTRFWFGKDEFRTVLLFESILKEFEMQYLGYYTVVQSLVSQIIMNAVRSFTQHKKSNYYIPLKIPDDSRRYIADTYFDDPSQELTPEALAGKIGVSVRQLERIMKQYYGVTFKEKLLETRLELAKHLLRSGELPIHLIAERTGFRSASYFSKTFREQVSLTPQQYRRQEAEEPAL